MIGSGEAEQLQLFKKRGGKRRGAGRPPKGQRAGSPHKERPVLQARYPVHVSLRVVSAVGNLGGGKPAPSRATRCRRRDRDEIARGSKTRRLTR